MSARLRVASLCALMFAAGAALMRLPPAPERGPVAPTLIPTGASEHSDEAHIAPAPRVVAEKPAGSVRVFGDARFRPITSPFAISPDGTRLVGSTNPWDGEAVVWDFATGRPVARLARRDRGWPSQVWFAPDGKSVLSIGGDNSYRVDFRRFDAATGKELERRSVSGLKHDHGRSFSFTRDGATVFGVIDDGALVRRNVRTGDTEWEVRFEEGWKPLSVFITPDERHLFVGMWDERQRHLRVFDARTGRERDRINPPDAGALVFAPDGKSFVVSAQLGTAFTVFDAATLEPRFRFKAARPSSPAAFSPDGRLFVAIDDRVALDVFEAATGKHLYAIPADEALGMPFEFTPDSKMLMVVRGGLALYDAATGKPLPGGSDPTYLDQYERIDFSPDGRTLTASAYFPSFEATWDLETGRELSRFAGREAMSRRLGWAVMIAPGGRFRFERKRGRFTVTDANGREVSSFARGEGVPRGDHFYLSGDGRVLFGCDGHTVERHDAATGKHLGTLADFRLTEAEVNKGVRRQPANPTVVPSPCGRYVVVHPRTWNHIDPVPFAVYDAVTEKKLVGWGTPWPGVLGWSADGGQLATALFAAVEPPDGALQRLLKGRVEKQLVTTGIAVRELPSGRVLRRASVPDGFGICATSPDLRMFVARDQSPESDPNILLCETATGQVRHVFRPGERWHHNIATFTPDGRYFATLHLGNPVVLWDVRGERLVGADPPGAAEWTKAWDALGGADAKATFVAIRLFAAFPERGAEVLRAKVASHAPTALAPARVAKLIAQLGSEEFSLRETATNELKALGRAAEPALRVAVKASPSPEVRDRINTILTGIGSFAPDDLRFIRAVEAAEWMGTTSAIRLLESWATGPPGATLTVEATSTLARLRK